MRAVIVNPASASGRTEHRWRAIVRALESGGGAPLEVQLTTCPGDAIAVARRLVEVDGVRELVVLGGDGTLGEVVAGCMRADGSGMLRDDLELAIVHQGTGGDLARGLGVPRETDEAIRVAIEGSVRRIDVGAASYVTGADDPSLARAHVRGFVSTANVGMAAEVVERVTGRLKRLGRSGAFAVATVACLGTNRPRRVSLTTAEGFDRELDVVDIDVCNNAWMGGGMHVAPDAQLDDGQFDVVVISAAGRTRLLGTFPRIYSGGHLRSPLVHVERTRRLEVGVPEGRRAEGVVLDGELVGRTPATFSVLPRAIGIRVPAAGG